MTASLIPTPVMQFLDADGNPLVGGKVYTYAAGTSTPLATYTNQGGGTANANPVILDSRGEAAIWFDAVGYKIILQTSADVLIWTADNVTPATTDNYGTGVATALAINVGTAGSILVRGGSVAGTTGTFSSTLAVTGAVTFASSLVATSSVTASQFNTSNGITATLGTGVTATIFDCAPRGMYLVFAAINNAGNTAFTSFATVVSEGSTYRIVANDGGSLPITLAGSSVKVAQNSGGSQPINYAYLKIA